MDDLFPKGFYFGTSTSSHQVEGGNHNNWTEWEKLNASRLAHKSKKYKKLPSWPLIKKDAKNPENYISGIAADYWNRFEEDLDLAKEMGTNAYRFSVEWSRVEPEKGKFDVEVLNHYRAMICAMRERKLEPFLTVWHFTLPLWLSAQGGARSKDFPKYIARYAGKLAQEFGNDVKFWITMNEPEIFARNSYLFGMWPPQKDNPFTYFKVLKNLVRAHREIHRAIRSSAENTFIGLSTDPTYFESAGSKWDNWLTAKAKYYWNDWLLDRVVKDLDFIGLNYYFHSRINLIPNRNPNEKVSDMGWELYPRGLEKILLEFARHGKPIYITESGLADERDVNRSWFIRESLTAVKSAIKKGVDVCGYFHWSLLDNFEWDKGFWPKFGLVEVNRRTLKRTPRPSAEIYKSIIKER